MNSPIGTIERTRALNAETAPREENVPMSDRDAERMRGNVKRDVEKMVKDFYHRDLKGMFERFYAKEENKSLSVKDAYLKFAAEQAADMRVAALDKVPNKVPNFELLSPEAQNKIISDALTARFEFHRSRVLKKDIPSDLKNELLTSMNVRLSFDSAYAQKMEQSTVSVGSLNSRQLSEALNIIANQTEVKDPVYQNEMKALYERNKAIIEQLKTARKELSDAQKAYLAAKGANDGIEQSQSYIDAKQDFDDATADLEDAKTAAKKTVNDFFSGAGKDLPPQIAAAKGIYLNLIDGKGPDGSELTEEQRANPEVKLPALTDEEYTKLSAAQKASYKAYCEATGTGEKAILTNSLQAVADGIEDVDDTQKALDQISGTLHDSSAAAADLVVAKQAALDALVDSEANVNYVNDAAETLKKLNIAVALDSKTNPETGASETEILVALNGKAFEHPENHEEALKTKAAYTDMLKMGANAGFYVPELSEAIAEGREPNFRLIESQTKAAGYKGEEYQAQRRAANIQHLIVSGQLDDALAEFDAEMSEGRAKDGLRHDGNYSQGGHYGAAAWSAMRTVMEHGSMTTPGHAMNAKEMNAALGTNISDKALGAVYYSIDEKNTRGLKGLDVSTDEGRKAYFKNVDQFGLAMERQIILATNGAYGISVSSLGNTRDVRRQRNVGQTLGVIFSFHNFVTRILPGATILRSIPIRGRGVPSNGGTEF